MKCNKAAFERFMKLNYHTNATLAEETGLNIMTVSNIRNGKKEPQARTLKKLCTALKCEPKDILED